MSFPAYEEYQDSGVEWLGEVPEGWEVGPLKYLSDIKTGFAFKSDDFTDDGVPILRIGDISTSGTVDFSDAKYLPTNYVDAHEDALVHQHDIVMAMTGATIGKAAKYTQDTPALLNQRVCIFRAYDATAQAYVWFLLQTSYYAEYLAITAFGGAQPNISDRELVGVSVPIPPSEEQTAIASFLGSETLKIDSLISEQRRLIELLKEKRQAVISHAVTKGLDPDVPMKDSGIEWLGDVPEHWEVVAIKHIVSTPVTDGPHETPEFIDEGIPFVSAEAVSSGKINFAKIRGFISQADHDSYCQKYKPERGDVYMVKSGASTGTTAIVEDDREFSIWSPLAAIRCDDESHPNFILNFLRSQNFQEGVTLNWSFGTQQNIGMKVIENLQITRPPLPEQRTIASFLKSETSKFDTLVAKAESAIELLQERRTALISAAVTGKIDVREFAYQETA